VQFLAPTWSPWALKSPCWWFTLADAQKRQPTEGGPPADPLIVEKEFQSIVFSLVQFSRQFRFNR
jgi:hypothetical protein